jgi:signal-transduction protein with cAMP-binding, CBS, and nucleotidyltransferase domain
MYLYFETLIHYYQMPIHRTTKISDIMTKNLETIGSSASAHDVAIKMRDKQVSSVLVMDERYGIPLGIVTERDLARKVCVTDKNSTQLLASKVMSFPLIKVNAEVSTLEAADLMLKNKVRHLLVVSTESTQEKNEDSMNEDKDLLKPVGIITPMDFIRYNLVTPSGDLLKDSQEDNDTERILEYYKNDSNFDR